MLKRQESSLSSSCREAPVTPPPETHHAKAIGCMSGILQLISKYQNRKKLLTSGRKQQEKIALSKSRNAKASSDSDFTKASSPSAAVKGLSSNITVPRSPTLPPEIRRSSAGDSSESRKPPSSLVARLMGLEDIFTKTPELDDDPIAEKRTKILQALDKCNEDLESLKKIIKRVQLQSSDHTRLQPPQAVGGGGDGGGGNDSNEHSLDVKTEELSPVCVLDEFTRSPLSSFNKLQNHGTSTERTPQQRKPGSTKKPGEDDHTIEYRALFQIRREAIASPGWITRAKLQSVEEVCSDIAWGEKREVGRIGLVLEDYICRDLIEEFVKELMKWCSEYSILPFEACKRRLLF